MKGRAVRLAAGCLLMIAATGTFLFPRICDQISRIRLLTEAYEAIVQDECENYEEAVRYNEKIARLQAEKAFAYAGAEAGGQDTEYLSLPAGGSDTICWVEVPAADIYLPVGHGTGEQTLAREAGHMYGTSFPAGGESVHAVIAAHTGLAGARLFTDLVDVRTGDLVLIHLGARRAGIFRSSPEKITSRSTHVRPLVRTRTDFLSERREAAGRRQRMTRKARRRESERREIRHGSCSSWKELRSS